MITIELLNSILLNRWFIALAVLFVLALTEYIFVYFIKTEKRDCNIVEFTIKYKFMSLLMSMIIILFLLLVIGLIVIYYIQVLVTLGIASLVIGFFWINSLVVKKYSVEVSHKHNFKKGDKLKATIKAADEEIACREGQLGLSLKYDYEFIGNSEYDYIKVKGLSKNSDWYNKTKTFKEDYFKKKK